MRKVNHTGEKVNYYKMRRLFELQKDCVFLISFSWLFIFMFVESFKKIKYDNIIIEMCK